MTILQTVQITAEAAIVLLGIGVGLGACVIVLALTGLVVKRIFRIGG